MKDPFLSSFFFLFLFIVISSASSPSFVVREGTKLYMDGALFRWSGASIFCGQHYFLFFFFSFLLSSSLSLSSIQKLFFLFSFYSLSFPFFFSKIAFSYCSCCRAFSFTSPDIYWLGLDENVGGVNYPTPFRVTDALTTAVGMGATVIRSHTLGVR